MRNLITIINLAILFGITSIFSRTDRFQKNDAGVDAPKTTEEVLVSGSENIGTIQSHFTVWPVQWAGDDLVGEKEEAAEDIITFLTEMTSTRMMDLEKGNIAAQKATERPLKDYGIMIAKHQSSMLAELKKLATKKNIELPLALDQEKAEDLSELKGIHGTAFDKRFIGMMIKDHKKNVKQLERATRSADADVQVFATKYLPVVQAHLDQIKALKRVH